MPDPKPTHLVVLSIASYEILYNRVFFISPLPPSPRRLFPHLLVRFFINNSVVLTQIIGVSIRQKESSTQSLPPPSPSCGLPSRDEYILIVIVRLSKSTG